MILNIDDYRNRVLGCWMGKNVGGTLGAPFEWKRQINHVDFYTQDLDGNPVPNDDLDIQLVWLVALEEMGLDINGRILGDYWMHYVTPHWAEYGMAKVNMKAGLMPPWSGTSNNCFKDSCGAYIRSEIWACIAPGCPEIAARYAYEDAIIDHGNGEGVYGEVFCAALESAAFVESDIYKLIDIGLSYIPEDCDVTAAVALAIALYKSGKTWLEARDEMIRSFHSGFHFSVSAEDVQKGFDGGKLGWEAPSNIGIVIIGLLYGKGDFGESLCIAVNCGEDTDCTAATLGSILGIINGIDAISDRWKKPIGENIKTMCLNLGEIGGQLPPTIQNLTDRVESIAKQVVARYHLPVKFSLQDKTDLSEMPKDFLFASKDIKCIFKYSNGSLFKFGFFDVYVDYVDGPVIHENVPKIIKVHIENRYKMPEMLNIQWYTPEGWDVLPSKRVKAYLNHTYVDGKKELEFELIAEMINNGTNRSVIEITVDGRASVMLVPVVLLNEVY